ncbi:MAG TPA: ammonium transporter [Desulfovibrio sp.]|jgi:Amt family ammonium transporter|uniref:ammonium transporter n=1 Tax=Desulfovibrio TaxID=872 RepID=UPI0004166AF3|nr:MULTISPECIES: ammonium transporter [Desulfovibrio]MDY0305536.1 ammonium transporter [Desulfovibrionaceae bacterium]HMM38752.1 ammonium transporter [Desulfovibrio sp.]
MSFIKSSTGSCLRGALGGAALFGLALAPALALAQDQPAEAASAAEAAVEYLTQTNANIMWTLIAAILVMFMQAGFAMVEVGLTRAKNAGNILMKNMFDFAAGSVTFYIIGFGLMMGADHAGLFGLSNFNLSEWTPATPEGLWGFTFWFFQCVFAATATTIVSGAIAERTKFISYLILSVVITGLIYPISGHWIWGGGWLSKLDAPVIDFAGSTVVHSVGGWVALAGALLMGPRIGKYTPDGKSRAIPGHNMALVALGVFILWFGWFGFNPGSTVAAQANIALIAVTTNLAACTGALGAMLTAWVRYGKPDVSMSFNGALAGLVAITAGCANVSPDGAMIIGLIAGVVVVLSVDFIDKVLKIDDPVGAISVHGVCGALGTLCVGLFASPDYGGIAGLFYGGGLTQFVSQALGVGSVFAWAFGSGLVVFTILKLTVGIRVPAEEEIKGLDITEHGQEAYSGFQIFTTE